MTDSPMRVNAGQPDAAPSGNVREVIIRSNPNATERDFYDAVAVHAQNVDRRMADRGHRPVGTARSERWILAAYITGAALLLALLAIGVANNLPGMGVAAAICLTFVIGHGTYRLGKSHAYDRTLIAGAIDTLHELVRVVDDAQARRAAAEAACDLALDLAPRPSGERYVYVLGFSSGAVKVGQTFDPARRIREHSRDAAAFNVNLVDFWVSPAHQNYLANEATLIAGCVAVSPSVRKEYFPNLAYADAIKVACGLTFYSADLSGRSIRGGRQ